MIGVLTLVTLLSLVYWFYSSKKDANLPPGPPADPIIGHLRRIPQTGQSEQFHEWAKTYGEIIHLRCLGRNMIVLDSPEAAEELLERRGAIYCSRPEFTILKLIGLDPTLAFLPYGKQFLKHRKIVQRYFGRQETLQYQPIQEKQARVLLNNLLAKPDDYENALNRFTTSIVIKIAYGHEINSDNDILMEMVSKLVHAVGNSGPAGNTPVDFFPFLQHLPSWFPGTYYAHFARKMRPAVRELQTYPYHLIKKKMEQGSPVEPCCMTWELEKMMSEQQEMTPEDVDDLIGAMGVIYAAGADTAWGSLSVFLVAMLFYPECQRRAQQEIDTVVGSDRLPDFRDRENMPYLEAIVQETLRWNPVVLLGIPHCSIEDDVYNGYFIPKGSVVFANTGGILRNEKTYKNPKNFDPTRFLPEGGSEPYPSAAFGYGRRLCPGRYLGEASLWIAMASILATLNISKVAGKDPVLEWGYGLARHPKKVPCEIKLRSEKAGLLIASA